MVSFLTIEITFFNDAFEMLLQYYVFNKTNFLKIRLILVFKITFFKCFFEGCFCVLAELSCLKLYFFGS